MRICKDLVVPRVGCLAYIITQLMQTNTTNTTNTEPSEQFCKHNV